MIDFRIEIEINGSVYFMTPDDIINIINQLKNYNLDK